MKTLMMSSIFLFVIVNASLVSESYASERQASEINFSLDIYGDDFNALKAVVYHNHPMQMFVSHPNSGREYRFELLVSEVPHEGESIPKVYLKINEKEYGQNGWTEHAAFEVTKRYDDDVQFSRLSATGEGIKGDIRVSTYDLAEEESSFSQTECASEEVLRLTSTLGSV